MTAMDSGSSTSTGGVTADAATTDHLTDATNSLTSITAYANAIANIVLEPATDPPADWFNTLKSSLSTAQTHAKTWVETLGPSVSSTVPQTIIDYGNLFMASAQDIITVLQTSNYQPDAAQRQQILGDITTLQQFIMTQQTTVKSLQAQLKTFQDDVLSDHTALSNGANGAQTALNLDQAMIDMINTQIDTVTADFMSASSKAQSSEIGLGLAIFITIVAVVAIVATMGAALPILVAGVGVVGIGASIATTVIFTRQQAEDYSKLQELNSQLSTEQAQVVSLKAILKTTQTLVTANEEASAALDKLADVWATLLTKIDSVLSDLNAADMAGDGTHFGAYLVKLWTEDANIAWSQLVTFCTNMQTALLNTTVTMATQPQAA